MDTKASIQALGLELHTLEEAVLAPSRRRRLLLHEGRGMLRYLGRSWDARWAARHYARAMETHQGGRVLDPTLPGLARPMLLAAVERRARRAGDDALMWRFDVALAIADTLEGDSLGRDGWPGRLGALFHLIRAVLFEAAGRLMVPSLRGRG
jgi:hypothetical protein